MTHHDHPPQNTVPQTHDPAPANQQADSGESLPLKSPHQCSHQGIPDPYTYSWDGFALDDDPLESVMVHAAAQRVLFALETVRTYFRAKAFDFAKAHLPADRYQEFYHLDDAAVSMDSAFSYATWQLAARLVPALPTKLGTL